MEDFIGQLDVEYESSSPRKAYRVSIPGLKVKIDNQENLYQALDISAGGVAFSITREDEFACESGQELEISLVIRDKTFLEKLQAILVKVTDSFAACEFKDIPLRQEALLDKLVLEVQKKMIELQRKKKEQEPADEKK